MLFHRRNIPLCSVTVCTLQNQTAVCWVVFLICACLHSRAPEPCSYMHLGGLSFSVSILTFALHSPPLLFMRPLTHLVMLADMDGNTNDPWWTKILSCCKAGGFRQFPSFAFLLEKEGPEFLTHVALWDLWPRPLQLPLQLSYWQKLAGEENKQITRKQTQHLISTQWHDASAQRAGWERTGRV